MRCLPALLFALSSAAAAQSTPGSVTTHSLPLGDAKAVIDAAGNVYAVSTGINKAAGDHCLLPGISFFPGSNYGPCAAVAIAKSDASGNSVYSTILGGQAADYGVAIAVDSSGNAYVTGATAGSFPTTSGAAIPTNTTSVTFAAKFSADGSTVLYSTYLPDLFAGVSGIAVDAQGAAYVAGRTTAQHALVVKISADGSSFAYTKALAGSNTEEAVAIAVDASGDVFAAGLTTSPDFPVTTGALQGKLAGPQNAFAASLDPNGNILSSTFLGGSGRDYATALVIDANNNVYLAGTTTSLDFPTTPGSFEPAPLVAAWSESPGGFFAKLSPDLSTLAYGSYIGNYTRNPAAALNASGDLYVVTSIGGAGFPLTPSAPLPCIPGNPDELTGAVLAHVDSHGELMDATYVNYVENFAALGVEADGSVEVAGEFLSTIRFGGPGWVAAPCMTPTVFNAATLAPSGVTAGEFVSLVGFGIGPQTGVSAQLGANGLPTMLGGVQVFFSGVAAPLLYAQSQQVTVQVPLVLGGQIPLNSFASVTLQYGGATYGPFSVEVGFANPGLFRLQPNITVQPAALNEDGTVNGPANPAQPGSFVSLWGTGFGATSPSCATGGLNLPGPASLAPGLSVEIFPSTVSLLYAGGAPGLLCGVDQINIQVPTSGPSGAVILNAQPVMTQSDGGLSESFRPAGAIIYIQ